MSAPHEPEPPPSNAFPIDLSPLSDPEAIAARDREWLEKVYARGVPQLTLRAAVAGMLLGSILGASNLYIGLKIGWNFGMSITASVLAFAIFSAVRKLVPGMSEFTMLENNTSQTAASAAAYMSSAGLVSSIPALTMLRREHVINVPELTPMQLTMWLLVVSVLGVVVAIPLKRNLINAEQLRFPSGIVCAETIRTMHAAGKESLAKARSLLVAGLFAAVMKFIFDCKLWIFRRLPETVGLPFMVRGYPAESWSFALNTSLLLYAAGAIVGLKVALSLAVGSAINYGFIGPWLLDHDVLRVATAADTATPAAWQAFVHAAEHDHAIPVRSAAALHALLRSKWSVWPGPIGGPTGHRRRHEFARVDRSPRPRSTQRLTCMGSSRCLAGELAVGDAREGESGEGVVGEGEDAVAVGGDEEAVVERVRAEPVREPVGVEEQLDEVRAADAVLAGVLDVDDAQRETPSALGGSERTETPIGHHLAAEGVVGGGDDEHVGSHALLGERDGERPVGAGPEEEAVEALGGSGFVFEEDLRRDARGVGERAEHGGVEARGGDVVGAIELGAGAGELAEGLVDALLPDVAEAGGVVALEGGRDELAVRREPVGVGLGDVPQEPPVAAGVDVVLERDLVESCHEGSGRVSQDPPGPP